VGFGARRHRRQQEAGAVLPRAAGGLEDQRLADLPGAAPGDVGRRGVDLRAQARFQGIGGAAGGGDAQTATGGEQQLHGAGVAAQAEPEAVERRLAPARRRPPAKGVVEHQGAVAQLEVREVGIAFEVAGVVAHVVGGEEGEHHDVRLVVPAPVLEGQELVCGAGAGDPEVDRLHPSRRHRRAACQVLFEGGAVGVLVGYLQGFGEGVAEEHHPQDAGRLGLDALRPAHAAAVEAQAMRAAFAAPPALRSLEAPQAGGGVPTVEDGQLEAHQAQAELAEEQHGAQGEGDAGRPAAAVRRRGGGGAAHRRQHSAPSGSGGDPETVQTSYNPDSRSAERQPTRGDRS